MAVRVMIPTPLRVYAGKRDSAEFRASTVGEALAQLTGEFCRHRLQRVAIDTDPDGLHICQHSSQW